MVTRVFLTGATGFIGGSILSALRQTHPEIHIKALVRRNEDAQKLQSIYPANFEPVIGTLEDLALLTDIAANVDFAIHAAHDNVPAVCAIIDGLASSSDGTPLPRFISVTGPRSLIDLSRPVNGGAEEDIRPWNDVDDTQTIFTFPKERIHAVSDQTSVDYGAEKNVGVMLVSPGQIPGRGKGHFKQEGACALYYAAAKSRGKAFIVGDGGARWSWVSVGDMTKAVVLLVEMALSPEDRGKVGVNREGYYFARAADFNLKERAEALSDRLQLGGVESVSVEVAKEINPFGPIMWASDVRFVAQRLTDLGWRPQELDWKALMAEEGGTRA